MSRRDVIVPSVWSAAALALILCAASVAKAPFGAGLDAWAIWGLKARLLFRGDWQMVFDPALSFSHPDYPLLYPFLTALGWRIAGSETPWVAWMVAGLFTALIAGRLTQAVHRLDRNWSWIAAAAIVFTPHFIGMGASLYADIVLTYFILAAALCACDDAEDLSVRAGMWAGLAALTKNEGLAFMAVLGAALLIYKRRSSMRYLSGAALPLVILAAIKLKAGFLQDAVGLAVPVGEWVPRAYRVILSIRDSIFNENLWVYGWFFVLSVYPLSWWGQARKGSGGMLWFVVLGMMVVYVAAFVLSPLGLDAHLRDSMDRLLLHLYPLSIYTAFFTLHLWLRHRDTARIDLNR